MSAIVDALLAQLTDADLDRLAERLVPRLAARVGRREDGDAWLRGAGKIAEYIGAPRRADAWA